MKILFTKSEYRTLFDMIYMAEWMLTAYDTETDPAKAKYSHLAQKIYSHAAEVGCESLVESSTAENQYFPTREYEEKGGVHKMIERYDADTFWDELIERLTERDVNDKMGVTREKPLSDNAYSALADPIAEVYEREFATNGVDRLRVDAG